MSCGSDDTGARRRHRCRDSGGASAGPDAGRDGPRRDALQARPGHHKHHDDSSRYLPARQRGAGRTSPHHPRPRPHGRPHRRGPGRIARRHRSRLLRRPRHPHRRRRAHHRQGRPHPRLQGRDPRPQRHGAPAHGQRRQRQLEAASLQRGGAGEPRATGCRTTTTSRTSGCATARAIYLVRHRRAATSPATARRRARTA